MVRGKGRPEWEQQKKEGTEGKFGQDVGVGHRETREIHERGRGSFTEGKEGNSWVTKFLGLK